MKKYSSKPFALFLLPLAFCSCSLKKAGLNLGEKNNISSIKFLSEYVVPYNLNYNNTIVGGLSGIDYDEKKNQYYIISDDPSQRSPARFYTAKIFISSNKIDSVGFIKVTNLLQPNGKSYPKLGTDKTVKPDAESIRYNPRKNSFVWSSEGERRFSVLDT
ncbi:hypothetical protein ACVWYG_001783 [Pedobacter sp. UYEF25]